MWGDIYRYRSVNNVIQEIKWLEEIYKIKAVYFQDLEFALNYERTKNLCEQMLKEKIRIKWACSARLDSVNKDILKLMKEARCIRINFGLESGSQEILSKAKKGYKLENVKDILVWCQKIKLKFGLSMMLCLPGENKETIMETVTFFKNNDLFLSTGNFPIPYPGTSLYKQAKTQLNKDLSWEMIGTYAGKIGTNLLNEMKESELIKLVRKLFLVKKFGIFFPVNPLFWLTIIKYRHLSWKLSKLSFKRLTKFKIYKLT
jgi:radical SAM superfamily enzyme YgiQ (UPF0313 family)